MYIVFNKPVVVDGTVVVFGDVIIFVVGSERKKNILEQFCHKSNLDQFYIYVLDVLIRSIARIELA